MPDGNLSWVQEQPSQGPPPSLYHETGERRRRGHHKSKNGCLNCKHRRIKCDEIRPRCSQCRQRDRDCEWPESHDSIDPPPSIPSQIPSSSALYDQLLLSLDKDYISFWTSRTSGGYTRDDTRTLLNHFFAPDNISPDAAPWLGLPRTQAILKTLGLRWATHNEPLLNAILAVSAQHLLFLSSGSSEVARDPSYYRKYTMAATLHYTHSLRRYTDLLVYHWDSDDVVEAQAEAVYACAILHAYLAFASSSASSSSSGGGHNIDLSWLHAMQGPRVLLREDRLRRVLLRSGGVWRETVGEGDAEAEMGEGRDGWVLEGLKELCEDSAAPHVFHSARVRLESLAMNSRHATAEVVDQYMAWIGDLPPDFVRRAREWDSLALLMIGCWSAMFGWVGQWWISGCAKGICRRICEHLENLQGLDAGLAALMRRMKSIAEF